jgi:hypothetical protein
MALQTTSYVARHEEFLWNVCVLQTVQLFDPVQLVKKLPSFGETMFYCRVK